MIQGVFGYRYSLIGQKILWLVAMVVLLPGCFRTQTPLEQGRYDFVSTPITYQVVSSMRDGVEMLPSERTYEFRTCLKDRVTLKTLALNEFSIDGDLRLSDEEGCVVWTRREEFNPYIQSQVQEDSFEIVGRGKYPGRLVIAYELNPWAGIRPSATAEFVEIFPVSTVTATEQAAAVEGDDSDLNQDEGSPRKAWLGVQEVKRSVFFHNDTSRGSKGHWNFEITPLLRVYDSRGVEHAVVPQNGLVDLTLEVLSLAKDLPLNATNLAKARMVQSITFEDQEIASGKIYVSEKVKVPQILVGNNVLLRVRLEGDSDLMKEGLSSGALLFFVRQSNDVETLQEVDLSDHESVAGELVVQPKGGPHPYYMAVDPQVRFLRYIKRTTTDARSELKFTTRLMHRTSGAVVVNEELYITYKGKTQPVWAQADGQIHFTFELEYDFYQSLRKLHELNFVISNKEKTLSMKLPLFLELWEQSLVGEGNLVHNPEQINNAATLAQLREVSFEKPQVFIDEISLGPDPEIDYDVSEDLSLGTHHAFSFVATAKTRSMARENFGGQRVMKAPDGLYRLDAYLSCPEEGLKNRQRYHVSVDDALEQVTIKLLKNDFRQKLRGAQLLAVDSSIEQSPINWGLQDQRRTLCPVSLTTMDVAVDDGKIVGHKKDELFRLSLPDTRLHWTRNQLTLVLTPYVTGAVASKVADTEKKELSQNVSLAPTAAMVVLKRSGKKKITVSLEDIREDMHESAVLGGDHQKRMKSLDQLKLEAKKWQVIHPYLARLNSLESDYLADFNLHYVPLEWGKSYSALPNISEGVDQWTCDVQTGECLEDTSKERTMSYTAFYKRFLEPGGRNMSVQEMREILWNKPGNRLADLMDYACDMWLLNFEQTFEEYFLTNPQGLLKGVKEGRWDPKKITYEEAVEEVYGAYGGMLATMKEHFRRIVQKCKGAHSEQGVNSVYDWNHRSITAVHHLKGDVKRVFAQDAGVDILNFRNSKGAAVSNAVALYASLHTDLLAAVGAMFKKVVGASLLGYSVSTDGEFDVSKNDQSGGGMTHYSNWVTVQLAMEFDQPKYCLTLRVNSEFFLENLWSMDFFLPNYRQVLGHVQYDPEYARQWFAELWAQLARGYLFCTEKQPDFEPIITEEGETLNPQVVGVEHYRFPEPRFESPTTYDTTLESYRDWVYPLRGQADYLKFMNSTIFELNKDNSEAITSNHSTRESLFQASHRFTKWVFEDKGVLDVQDHLFSTSQGFVKFPKQFLYDRFSAVPPSVGGFYNY